MVSFRPIFHPTVASIEVTGNERYGYSMILKIAGMELIPGNQDCPGNGEHVDKNGNTIDCCYDECDDMMCCLETHPQSSCKTCTDTKCPHAARSIFART